jgi:hypothetical protein
MKKLISYIVCIIFTLSADAQDKKQSFDNIPALDKKRPFPFDELTISGNRTTVGDSYTHDRFGFGTGMYHTSLKKYPVNFIIGIEYNRTNLFKYSGGYTGHFSYQRDVTYHLNTISTPLFFRFNFGNRVKFFLETGAYIDINLICSVTGIVETDSNMDSLGHYHYTESKFRQGAELKFFNCGATGGIGVSIPLNSQLDLILKSDYRYGIRNLMDSDVFFNRYLRAVVGIKWNH